jgi:hypothetical protein
MIPALLLPGARAQVPYVAQHSQKAQQHITVLPMAKSIVYPVVNPNTGSSFQPLLMKKFTME